MAENIPVMSRILVIRNTVFLNVIDVRISPKFGENEATCLCHQYGFSISSMKHIITLITFVFTLPGSLAFADHFETLAGYRDSIEVPAGEAALVLYATDAPTVQYQKKGKRPVQFRMGQNRRIYSSRYRSTQQQKTPSAGRPLALVGPAKISLMTDGVVSIRIITSEEKK